MQLSQNVTNFPHPTYILCFMTPQFQYILLVQSILCCIESTYLFIF